MPGRRPLGAKGHSAPRENSLQALFELTIPLDEKAVNVAFARNFRDGGPDPRAAAIMLGEIAKERRADLAIAALRFFQLSGPEVNAVHYGIVFNACAKGVAWASATNLVGDMGHLGVEPNTITYSATISACERGAGWKRAFSFLQAMARSTIQANVVTHSTAMSACEKGGEWARALKLFDAMARERVLWNTVVFNAAISACAKGAASPKALELLSAMARDVVEIDTISCNAVITACGNEGEAARALQILRGMKFDEIPLDAITYSAAITACEREGDWATALGLLAETWQRTLRPDVTSYSAAISACEKGERWEEAVAMLAEMKIEVVQPDVITYKALIGACEAGDQEGLGLELLKEWRESGVEQFLSSFMWALARLCVKDPGVIGSAAEEALQRLLASEQPPQELATLSWALAALAVDSLALSCAVARRAMARVEAFGMRDLLLLAWGAAMGPRFDVELSITIQNQVELRLRRFDWRGCSDVSRRRFLRESLGVVWACNFAGMLSGRLLATARDVLTRMGEHLDNAKAQGPGSVEARADPVRTFSEQLGVLAATHTLESEPIVALDVSDRLIVFKPSGWGLCEIGDEYHDILAYVRGLSPNRWPILFDEARQCGFMHRLDVPSSGLILVAKTYKAYYDLLLQLNAGGLAREYITLCHGVVAPFQRNLRARVRWRGGPRDPVPTSAGTQGKPSHTELKVVAQVHFARERSL